MDDEPAKLFAKTFYQALTEKKTFAEAVGAARERTCKTHPDTNTWAAYQCYGDPDWRYILDDASREARTSRSPSVVSPPDLTLELETLVAQARYDKEARNAVRTRLEQLDGQHAASWGNRRAVAQGLGAGYSELGDAERANHWVDAPPRRKTAPGLSAPSNSSRICARGAARE